MIWCEDNGIDYAFGLSRLEADITKCRR